MTLKFRNKIVKHKVPEWEHSIEIRILMSSNLAQIIEVKKRKIYVNEKYNTIT